MRFPAREAFCPTVKRGWKKKFNTTRVADASSFFSFLDGRFLSQDIEGRSTPPAAGCFARPSRHRRAVSLFRPALGRERRVPSAAPRFRLGASGVRPSAGRAMSSWVRRASDSSRARSARARSVPRRGTGAGLRRGRASGDVVLRRSRTPPRGAGTTPSRSAADLPREGFRGASTRTTAPESSSSPSPGAAPRASEAAARGAAPSRDAPERRERDGDVLLRPAPTRGRRRRWRTAQLEYETAMAMAISASLSDANASANARALALPRPALLERADAAPSGPAALSFVGQPRGFPPRLPRRDRGPRDRRPRDRLGRPRRREHRGGSRPDGIGRGRGTASFRFASSCSLASARASPGASTTPAAATSPSSPSTRDVAGRRRVPRPAPPPPREHRARRERRARRHRRRPALGEGRGPRPVPRAPRRVRRRGGEQIRARLRRRPSRRRSPRRPRARRRPAETAVGRGELRPARGARGRLTMPIGRLTVGLRRHRALLFKVAADALDVPSRLVRGGITAATSARRRTSSSREGLSTSWTSCASPGRCTHRKTRRTKISTARTSRRRSPKERGARRRTRRRKNPNPNPSRGGRRRIGGRRARNAGRAPGRTHVALARSG